jgi:hypothetical protein
MTEESNRMLSLLQELAGLKEAEDSGTPVDAALGRKRRKEISKEMKQLAADKKDDK